MPSSLEEYVQETGRAECDGHQSSAVLYEGKGGRCASLKVKNYVTNSTHCRHRFPFQEFLLYTEDCIRVSDCTCCDVCGNSCTCEVWSAKE